MNSKYLKNIILGVLLGFHCGGSALAVPPDSPRISRTDFNKNMRKVWEDHIVYTRLYIVNTLAGLPAKGATANRLMANQADIGNLLEPFYGEEAGAKLTALLKDHINIAAEVIDGAKKGDTAKQNSASKRWYANSDAIAVFLENINPKHWPADDMRKMLREHLDTTSEEVTDNLKKDWDGDIAAYDKLHDQILKMADVLSSGITQQFPHQFKRESSHLNNL